MTGRAIRESEKPNKLPVVRSLRVALTGFMGSGKSTVGKLIAEHLGWTFIDLDSAIEERCGQTVPQIFAEHGEEHFRKQESATLSPFLERSQIVIALGGGAPETPANRELLQASPSTSVVFLDAPFDVLHARCTNQAKEPSATSRPLLADRDSALARFQARQKLYETIATFHLDTTHLSPGETAEAVLRHLQ